MEFNTFDDYFNNRSTQAFQEMASMDIPIYEELIKIYKNSNQLLEDFLKMKNPPNMPPLKPDFVLYLTENLTKGYSHHCPIYYSTEQGLNSFRYASPELVKLIWINMKSSLVWYKQLLKDGYFIEE